MRFPRSIVQIQLLPAAPTINYEADLPTQEAKTSTNPRVPEAYADQRWSQHLAAPSDEGASLFDRQYSKEDAKVDS